MYPEERNDAIAGDSLKEAGRSRQTLKPCPTGGEEGAKHNDPGRGPCQGANNQVTVHAFPKSAFRTVLILLTNSIQ